MPPPDLRAAVNAQLHALGQHVSFIAAARPYALVESYYDLDRNGIPASYERIYAFRESCNCWLVLAEARWGHTEGKLMRTAGVPETAIRQLIERRDRDRPVFLHNSWCPPANAVLHHERAVLEAVSIGNDQGSVTIRTRSGTRWLYAGANLTVGGYRATCVDWKTGRCEGWPAGYRVGHAVVDVTYWRRSVDPYDDTLVEVTNQIDLVRP